MTENIVVDAGGAGGDGELLVDMSWTTPGYRVRSGDPLQWTKHALERAAERGVKTFDRVPLGIYVDKSERGSCVVSVQWRGLNYCGEVFYYRTCYAIAETMISLAGGGGGDGVGAVGAGGGGDRIGSVVTCWKTALEYVPVGVAHLHTPETWYDRAGKGDEARGGHRDPRRGGPVKSTGVVVAGLLPTV